MATSRLQFILDGRDQLSRIFDRAGDSANRLHRRIDTATSGSSASVARFTTDANGRLRDLRGRFLSTAEAARVMAGDTSFLPPALGDVSRAASGAAGSSGHLGGAMATVAAIAGLSLLPALGAIVPMAAGAGLAVGTLTLGFKGVGEAAALASEDKKKYREALKKLSPEAREFTKALVGVKSQFSGLGKDVQKAMLPGFTQALKFSGPLVKLLGRGMTEMGRGFGQAAAGLGRLMKDAGFQREFGTVLRLGGVFVKDLTSGIGGLARGFLSFGAASGPTLSVLSGGIRDLLGKGLPGMFKGLETGIGGTAKFLSGFFSMINMILPAIGRFAGEVARTFGPILGELAVSSGQRTSAMLGMLGGAVRFLAPIFKDLAYGVQSTTQLFAILAPTIKDTAGAILGSLIPAGMKVDEMKGPFQRLSEAIERNKGLLQEGARVMANAVLDLVEAGVSNLPNLIGSFRSMSLGVLQALAVIVSGAAKAFGWIPGIGDKLRAADREFGKFKGSYLRGLAAAEQKTREFSQSVLPRLQNNRLKVNISNWESQLQTAKAQLRSVPPEKKARLLADIRNLEAKIRSARAQLNSLDGKTARTYVVTYRSDVRVGGVSNPGTGGPGGFPKYARGGRPQPGWALVGEEGPELVKFRGGEQVYDHRTSVRMASPSPLGTVAGGGGMTVNVTVNGAMDPIAVAQQLRTMLIKLQRNMGLQPGVIMR